MGCVGLWDLLGISETAIGLAHNRQNSRIPHQIPEAHKICLWFQNTVLYTGTAVKTVKLNFHLELYATLVSNLTSGLGLELQVFCESSCT